MVINNVFGLNSSLEPATPGFFTRVRTAVTSRFSHVMCGLHGHLIMMHYEPNRLSLQCALCGYQSEGWDVGRPLVARRSTDVFRAHAHPHQHRPERRGIVHPLPAASPERMAS